MASFIELKEYQAVLLLLASLFVSIYTQTLTNADPGDPKIPKIIAKMQSASEDFRPAEVGMDLPYDDVAKYQEFMVGFAIDQQTISTNIPRTSPRAHQ